MIEIDKSNDIDSLKNNLYRLYKWQYILGKIRESMSVSISKRKLFASDKIENELSDLIVYIATKQLRPFFEQWLEDNRHLGEDEPIIQKNIDLFDEIVSNLSKMEGFDLGDKIAHLNQAIGAYHQSGPMIDRIGEYYDIDEKYLEYLSNISDSELKEWENEIKEMGYIENKIYFERDNSTQQTAALSVYSKIKSYLDSYIDKSEEEMLSASNSSDLWKSNDILYKNRGNSWIMDVGKLLGNKDMKLLVMFTPENTRSGFGFWEDYSVIVLNGVLYKDGTPAFINTRLRSFRETFVHEYVHYLDEMRKKTDKKLFSIDKGEKKYFNSPQELNAYFQEFVTKYNSYMKIPGIAEHYKLDTYDGVEKLFKKEYSDMWNNLTEQNRKRLQKRIYDLWKNNQKLEGAGRDIAFISRLQYEDRMEEFKTGLKDYKGDYFEVYKNPGRYELRDILGGDPEHIFRGILTKNDVYVFNDDCLHSAVIGDLKEELGDEYATIIFDDTGIIMVTDSMKRSRLYHNPEIISFIRNNDGLRKILTGFGLDIMDSDISFYDEAVVGNWSELEDE